MDKKTITGLVSIITPVFNSERFVSQTIESVKNQTYDNWEHLLVVDSGTTDNSVSVINKYAVSDSRIKLIEIKNKRGISLSRNAALEAAQGEWIAFLDSDDMWLPEKLARQIEFMHQMNADFSCGGYRKISENSDKTGDLRLPPTKQTYTDLLGNNLISCPTVMYNQKNLGQFKMREHAHEDYILWLDLLKHTTACYGLREDLARYRIVNNSRSMNVSRSGSRWIVLRKIEKLNLLISAYYFCKYAITALWKRLIF